MEILILSVFAMPVAECFHSLHLPAMYYIVLRAVVTAVRNALVHLRDRVVNAMPSSAEWVVEILIDMQPPGCQWLTLLEEVA